jgi:hypothetical protein
MYRSLPTAVSLFAVIHTNRGLHAGRFTPHRFWLPPHACKTREAQQAQQTPRKIVGILPRRLRGLRWRRLRDSSWYSRSVLGKRHCRCGLYCQDSGAADCNK